MFIRGITAYCLILGAILPLACPAVATPPAPGDSIADLRFQTPYYDTVALSDLPDRRAYVLFFFSNTCPVARRYMGRIGELAARFGDDGVQFIAVNASPADSMVDVAQHALRYGLEFPVVKDVTFDVVRMLGATRTPEVIVLDGDRTLRYRGRIDDQYRLGGVRPRASRADLALALEEILAGEPVSRPETPAEGCIITFPMLPKPAAALDFETEIRPILAEFCIGCHKTEGSAPFPLDTPTALRDKKTLVLKTLQVDRMPPSFAARESGTVRLHRLPYRAQHQIANWLQQEPGSADAVPHSQAPAVPNTATRTTYGVAEAIAVTGAGQVVERLVGGPFETETWVRSVAVQGTYHLGFHYAEVYCETPGDTSSRRMLTGPVLPGIPLTWEDGGGIRIPPGATLGLRIHYRAAGETGPDRPVLVADLSSEASVEEIRVERLVLDDKVGHDVSTFPMAGSLRAITIHTPERGNAVTVERTDGTEAVDVLSLPTGDPDWPITYVLEKDVGQWVEDAMIIARVHTPGYLRWPRASQSETQSPERSGTTIAVYCYWGHDTGTRFGDRAIDNLSRTP